MVVVAIAGFSDAAYLSYEYLRAAPVVCPVFGDGCFKVEQSRYAEFFGIPTPLFGVAFYLVMFGFILWYFLKEKKVVLNIIGLLSLAGFLVAIMLTYIQYYILDSFCFYCLISATSSTLIFILGCTLLFLVERLPNGKNKI
jgi:uncharacterized membrane protein